MSLALPARFRPIRLLGEGGMGVVYEAFDTALQERVAVKTMRSMSPESLAAFKREFRVMRDVRHRNLIALGELVGDDDHWCFSMELVEGESLTKFVRPTARAVDDATVNDAVGASTFEPVAAARPRRSGEGPLDELALRDTFSQLAEALHALHATGLVHRDVKPNNVMVTGEGRTVLLDFGVAIDVTDRDGSITKPALGTPTYMAPEQASGAKPTPAADWYAFGAVLYEVLAGEPPFQGTALQVLLAKASGAIPRPPSAIAPGVPADLEALCLALLAAEPSARPDFAHVRRALDEGKTASAPRVSVTPPVAGWTPTWAGRADELAELQRAWTDVASKQAPIAALVRGDSGVGKSALVRRFVDRVYAEDPRTVVLSGRCFLREDVPFRALDGVIDALVRFLRKQPHGGAAFVPTRRAALARVFPALMRVTPIGDHARAQDVSRVAPLELRRLATASLRDLFTRVANSRPLVLFIDDLQWADHDSLAILSEVLRPPDAPPILLLGTARKLRSNDAETTIVLPCETRTIALECLPPNDAARVALALAERAGIAQRIDARTLAIDGEGHPLFIDALVRYIAHNPEATSGSARFDDVLRWRVGELAKTERTTLTILALVGGSMRIDALGAATGLPRAALLRQLDRLHDEQLVALGGRRDDDLVDVFHDRLRVAAFSMIDPAERPSLHRKIARALERTRSTDFGALAEHWAAACERATATRHRLRAADAAIDALAFDRAANLYAQVLAEPDLDADARVSARRKLADALAGAGRASDAAEAYFQAAKDVPGTESLTLESLGADQLVHGGQLDRGLDVHARILRRIDERLPGSPLRAVLQVVLLDLWLRVRGLRLRAQAHGEVDALTMMKLVVLSSVSGSVSIADVLLGAAINKRFLVEALRAGVVRFLVQALSNEATHLAVQGPKLAARAETLHLRARALATSGSYEAAYVEMSETVAAFAQTRFRRCVELSARAEAQLLETARGHLWEVSVARAYGLRARWLTGDLRELVALKRAYLDDARARGDLYMTVELSTGETALTGLLRDDPDGVSREWREAIRRWSKRGFHLEHQRALLTAVTTSLYVGDAADACARVDANWAAYRRSLLWRVELVRLDMLVLRGRSRLALAAVDPSRRAALASSVRSDAARVATSTLVPCSAQAALLSAGAQAVATSRDHPRVVEQLRAALVGFESHSMALLAATTRLALADAIGGAEGASLRAASRAWFAEQGVKDPARLAAAHAPGLLSAT